MTISNREAGARVDEIENVRTLTAVVM